MVKKVLKLAAMYALCYTGGYGAGTMIREGFEENKLSRKIIGIVLGIASIFGAYFGCDRLADDLFEESEEDEERRSR